MTRQNDILHSINSQKIQGACFQATVSTAARPLTLTRQIFSHVGERHNYNTMNWQYRYAIYQQHK